jgi:hypothetical protein
MGTEHQACELQAEIAGEIAFESYREEMLIRKYGVNDERDAKNIQRSKQGKGMA